MAGRATALTEKTEAVLQGLVDRAGREKGAGLRPAFPEAASPAPHSPSRPEPPDQHASPTLKTATRQTLMNALGAESPTAAIDADKPPTSVSPTSTPDDGPIHLLIGRPRSIDDVVTQFVGPEIREEHPVHRGFYLNPEHIDMIEAITNNTSRGRSAIVRSAITMFYIVLNERGLLGPNQSERDKAGKDRGGRHPRATLGHDAAS